MRNFSNILTDLSIGVNTLFYYDGPVLIHKIVEGGHMFAAMTGGDDWEFIGAIVSGDRLRAWVGGETDYYDMLDHEDNRFIIFHWPAESEAELREVSRERACSEGVARGLDYRSCEDIPDNQIVLD